MGLPLSPRLSAILGPTNTGKTHLAIERLCGHASGMIGFPLRLLAREVYDRVCALKGPDQAALITGEEKIVPPQARYFLCTAESMPLDRDLAFVALDEAQMATDAERGHIFTNRLLNARGFAETMILGSDTLRPLVRALTPTAELVARPRFSTLAHAEPRKLGRLPRRSAIVAFTAEDVYAIAEMLRRQKGGAAVVMGALSPRTRNAQVAMFQNGEVDYLVATDAIGMGLNLDIAHVAFASLTKFDGQRLRRLTTPEMAQIAGRAGRHQRDGSFGVAHLGTDTRLGFLAEEIAAIENHSFPPLERLKWRNADLDFSSLDALVATLEQPAPLPLLERTGETLDLAVLRRLARDADIAARARGPAMVRRLWAACQLPDFRKTTPDTHAPLVGRIFRHLSDPGRRIPTRWIAEEVSRLDTVQGDIATLSGRIAAIRTWTYIAHQPDWVETGEDWAERTRAVEDKLSDALHQALTQRFVDRRTALLLRDLGDRQDLSVRVEADGAVQVDGETLGSLSGFAFSVDPASSHGEKRLVMAAAEKTLQQEFMRRTRQLADDDDAVFELAEGPAGQGGPAGPQIRWRGATIATLHPGRTLVTPQIRLTAGADRLEAALRTNILTRLQAWLNRQLDIRLAALVSLDTLLADRAGTTSGACRGIAYQLLDQGGCLERDMVADLLGRLTGRDRAALRQCGVVSGTVHLFAPALLKPEASRWRLMLWHLVHGDDQLPALPGKGRMVMPATRALPRAAYAVVGFWPVGRCAIRVDRVERIATLTRRLAQTRGGFVPPPGLACEAGLSRGELEQLLEALGYRRQARTGEIERSDDAPSPHDGEPAASADQPGPTEAPPVRFAWRGRRRHKPAAQPAASAASPFAALGALNRGLP